MRVALVGPNRAVQKSITPLLGAQGHEVLSCANSSDALAKLLREAMASG